MPRFLVHNANSVSDHPVSQMPSAEPHATRKPLRNRTYSTSFVACFNMQTQSPAHSCANSSMPSRCGSVHRWTRRSGIRGRRTSRSSWPTSFRWRCTPFSSTGSSLLWKRSNRGVRKTPRIRHHEVIVEEVVKQELRVLQQGPWSLEVGWTKYPRRSNSSPRQ